MAKKKNCLFGLTNLKKPMICHAKTNFKGLESATGTPFVELWIGKRFAFMLKKMLKHSEQQPMH